MRVAKHIKRLLKVSYLALHWRHDYIHVVTKRGGSTNRIRVPICREKPEVTLHAQLSDGGLHPCTECFTRHAFLDRF
jgi:hypothetical protein